MQSYVNKEDHADKLALLGRATSSITASNAFDVDDYTYTASSDAA